MVMTNFFIWTYMKMAKCIIFILFTFLTPSLCIADVYKYEDSGVIHLTNVQPPGKRYNILIKNSEQKAVPTYGSKASFKNLKHYETSINYHSDTFGMDPALVKAVMKTESNFNPRAVSKKGAQGLMQLMPDTARLMRVNNPFDPEDNMKSGIRYLKSLQETFGDLDLTLAAYNAGPRRVIENRMQVPPIRETRDFIRKVKYYYNILKQN